MPLVITSIKSPSVGSSIQVRYMVVGMGDVIVSVGWSGLDCNVSWMLSVEGANTILLIRPHVKYSYLYFFVIRESI